MRADNDDQSTQDRRKGSLIGTMKQGKGNLGNCLGTRRIQMILSMKSRINCIRICWRIIRAYEKGKNLTKITECEHRDSCTVRWGGRSRRGWRWCDLRSRRRKRWRRGHRGRLNKGGRVLSQAENREGEDEDQRRFHDAARNRQEKDSDISARQCPTMWKEGSKARTTPAADKRSTVLVFCRCFRQCSSPLYSVFSI